MEQITNTILMIRPVSFHKNEETALNNYFQSDMSISQKETQHRAEYEFDLFVLQLRC